MLRAELSFHLHGLILPENENKFLSLLFVDKSDNLVDRVDGESLIYSYIFHEFRNLFQYIKIYVVRIVIH